MGHAVGGGGAMQNLYMTIVVETILEPRYGACDYFCRGVSCGVCAVD